MSQANIEKIDSPKKPSTAQGGRKRKRKLRQGEVPTPREGEDIISVLARAAEQDPDGDATPAPTENDEEVHDA